MTIHVVRAGESLYRIGEKYGVPWRDIYDLNLDLIGPDPSRLRIGDELLIPVEHNQTPNTVGNSTLSYRRVASEPTAHRWLRRGRVEFIVMHDPVAITPHGLLRYLRKNDRKVSYNEVIVPGNPPEVHTLVPDLAWVVGHAGFGSAISTLGSRHGRKYGDNLNDWSWGICIFKHRDDNGPFPGDMLSAAVVVASERADQFDIPTSDIRSHGEADPARRSDPRGLNMDRFREMVADYRGL